MAAHSNKAHTATARRIAARYGGAYNEGDGIDISADGMYIEVETTATLEDGVARLLTLPGRVFVAVTNQEGLAEALRLTKDSHVGVMDPRGNIVKDSLA